MDLVFGAFARKGQRPYGAQSPTACLMYYSSRLSRDGFFCLAIIALVW